MRAGCGGNSVLSFLIKLHSQLSFVYIQRLGSPALPHPGSRCHEAGSGLLADEVAFELGKSSTAVKILAQFQANSRLLSLVWWKDLHLHPILWRAGPDRTNGKVLWGNSGTVAALPQLPVLVGHYQLFRHCSNGD